MKTGTKYFLIVAFLIVTAACGGGGEGVSPTAPSVSGGVNPSPTTVTGSVVSVSNASILFGASSGASIIVWSSNAARAGDVRLRVNGTEVSSQRASPADGLSVQVGNGDVRVELVNASGLVLDTKTASASCALGAWHGGRCDRFRFDRLDVVILQVTPEQFFALKDGKAIPFVNKTGYSAGPGVAFPLSNCGLYDVVREDGAPLFSCTTPGAGNLRRTFPVNPVTLEILPEYTEQLPSKANLVATVYGTFGDTPYTAYGVWYKGMYIEVPGYGVYYMVSGDDKRIRFTRDGFQTYTTVVEAEGIRVFYSFSNTN